MISRCTRFRFTPIDISAIKDRLNTVIIKENVNISPEAIDALLKLSNGDMRRALNVLQSCKAALGDEEKKKMDMPMMRLMWI